MNGWTGNGSTFPFGIVSNPYETMYTHALTEVFICGRKLLLVSLKTWFPTGNSVSCMSSWKLQFITDFSASDIVKPLILNAAEIAHSLLPNHPHY